MHTASGMRIAALLGLAHGLRGSGLSRLDAATLGLGWMLAGLSFAAAAIGVGRGAAWGLLATAATAALSIGLCIGAAPAKNTGFVIDVIILSTAALLQASADFTIQLP
jgi:hypothetical protein